MEDKDRCWALVAILISALMASPWVVYVMRERDRERARQKRKKRGPKNKPPGEG